MTDCVCWDYETPDATCRGEPYRDCHGYPRETHAGKVDANDGDGGRHWALFSRSNPAVEATIADWLANPGPGGRSWFCDLARDLTGWESRDCRAGGVFALTPRVVLTKRRVLVTQGWGRDV